MVLEYENEEVKVPGFNFPKPIVFYQFCNFDSEGNLIWEKNHVYVTIQ